MKCELRNNFRCRDSFVNKLMMMIEITFIGTRVPEDKLKWIGREGLKRMMNWKKWGLSKSLGRSGIQKDLHFG